MGQKQTTYTPVSKVQLNKCTVDSINVCGNTVKRSKAIKLLGMMLDEQLSFKAHIVQKCKSAMYGLLQIKHIRCYLTREACELLVHGLVISHIDYCNSLFAGLPDVDIGKLQRVQNTAVKVILQKTRYDQCHSLFKRATLVTCSFQDQSQDTRPGV